MNQPLLIAIIICSLCGIATELHTIIFPGVVTDLLRRKEPVDTTPGMIVLSILSLLYLIDMFLLAFSGDSIFILYAAILGLLSILMLAFQSFFARFKVLMMVESTICLIILLDVVRSILRISGLFHGVFSTLSSLFSR